MKINGKIVLLVTIVLLLGSLIYLNPTREEHYNKFNQEFKEMHPESNAFNFDGVIDNALSSKTTYKNYLLFSKLVNIQDNETITIGYFGDVYVLSLK